MIKWLEKHRTFSLIITIAIAVEIFIFSTLHGGGTGKSIPLLPTIYHFVVFFLLTFFLLTTIKGNNKLKKSHMALVILITILYAISDEIHQMFVPLRSATIKDVLIDSLGIFLAIIIYSKVNKKTNQ